jgi:putative transposon-encoded protein
MVMEYRKLYISIDIFYWMVKKINLKEGKLSITDDVELVFEKVVTKFGTGAKADIPRKYLGKKVYIIIQK